MHESERVHGAYKGEQEVHQDEGASRGWVSVHTVMRPEEGRNGRGPGLTVLDLF